MTIKEITLGYFNSWQEPADFDLLASYLTDSFKIDAGFFSFNDKNSFISFIKANPTPRAIAFKIKEHIPPRLWHPS